MDMQDKSKPSDLCPICKKPLDYSCPYASNVIDSKEGGVHWLCLMNKSKEDFDQNNVSV